MLLLHWVLRDLFRLVHPGPLTFDYYLCQENSLAVTRSGSRATPSDLLTRFEIASEVKKVILFACLSCLSTRLVRARVFSSLRHAHVPLTSWSECQLSSWTSVTTAQYLACSETVPSRCQINVSPTRALGHTTQTYGKTCEDMDDRCTRRCIHHC